MSDIPDRDFMVREVITGMDYYGKRCGLRLETAIEKDPAGRDALIYRIFQSQGRGKPQIEISFEDAYMEIATYASAHLMRMMDSNKNKL